METSFPSEIVVPGVFVRVQAENLITAGGVSSGNIGIVGTAAAASGVTDALERTHILSSIADARDVYQVSDAMSAASMNLMRSIEILFRAGARTVYAYGVPVSSNQQTFTDGFAELAKDAVNILVAPELDTSTAVAVMGLVDTQETNGKDMIAVIGCDGEDVSAVTGQVSANKRFIMTTPGFEVFDPEEGTDGQNVTLSGTYSAAAVAGLISSLAVQNSPTNKTIPGITTLAKRYSYGETVSLLNANIVPLEDRQGIRVVRGLTTEGAAFKQITTRRIVDFAKAGVRQVSNPFIGRLNNERIRKSMQGAIDGFLSNMVVNESLIGYSLEVKASRQDQIAGRAVVNIAMQPVFSIDFIHVTLVLS
ncbi:MAG: phage tail sheath subtilisin-like domain-containing protein [Pseudomonadales bacterium]|nr:phage tail sheath subtilisin-like domain-containing protein [Pseudomonadales bacterium]